MKNKAKKNSFIQRLLALVMVAAMAYSFLPTSAFAATAVIEQDTKVSDGATAMSYQQMLGTAEDGNRYAGRIWSDKSVFENYDDFAAVFGEELSSAQLSGLTFNGQDEFMTVYSTLGSTTSVTTHTAGDLDVMLILDQSTSMVGNRMTTTIEAANKLMHNILSDESNRLAIVTYNDNAETVLPLDHYQKKDANQNYLTIANASNRSDGEITANLVSLTTNNTVEITNSGYQSGTNLQSGIDLGMSILATTSDTTNRIPVVILLTDGAANTAVTTEWYNVQSSNMRNSSSLTAPTAVSTLLNAAYRRTQVEDNYGTAPYVYGIGVDISSNASAKLVMDPANYFTASNTSSVPANAWNIYQNWLTSDNTVTYSTGSSGGNRPGSGSSSSSNTWYFQQLPGGSSVTKQDIEDNINYVDQYHDVDSADLAELFEDIYKEITSKAFLPVVDVTTADGTVSSQTYVDFLGDYMQVKEMYGITLEVFTSVNDSSGVTYYPVKLASTTTDTSVPGKVTVVNTYVPDTDDVVYHPVLSGVSIDLDRAISIKTTLVYDVADGERISAGDQEVRVTVAEEAMPLLYDKVDTDAAGNLTFDEFTTVPLRLYYTVGLSEYILDGTGTVMTDRVDPAYQEANTENNVLYFYTNQYGEMSTETDAAGNLLRGDAHISATPNTGNRYYYHQYNSPVYVSATSANGTPVEQMPGADVEYGVLYYQGTGYLPSGWTNPDFNTQYLTYANVAGLDNQLAAGTDPTVYALISFHRPTAAANDGNAAEAVGYLAYTKWSQLKGDLTFYDSVNGVYINGKSGDSFITSPTTGYYVDPAVVAEYISAKGLATTQVVAALGVDTWRVSRLSNMTTAKTSNPTGTAKYAVAPVRNSDSAHVGNLVAWLGNNGRLGVKVEPMKKVYSSGDLDTNIDGKPVMVGDELVYTIDVKNTTANTATVTAIDTIPAGTAYVPGSATENGVYDASANTITWTVNDLPSGAAKTVSFKVVVTEDALSSSVAHISNTATIRIGNNSYTTNTTDNAPEGKAGVVSGGSTDGVKAGDTLSYTIQAVNDTDGKADIVITDVIPAGTVYVPGSAEHAGATLTETTAADGSVTELKWVFKTVGSGVAVTVEFQAVVIAQADASVENTATIQVGDNDPKTTNTIVDTMTYGALTLTKTVVDGNARGDQDKYFTVTLSDVNAVSHSELPALEGTFAVTDSSDANSVTFTDGVATLRIKHGEEITIEKLPAGVTLLVQETQANGYTPAYSATQVVVTTAGAQVDVTNTYNVTPIEVFLTGTKNLTNPMVVPATFSFVAEEWDVDSNAAVSGGKLTTGEVSLAPGATQANIVFGALNFNAAGEYCFRVYEVSGSLTGVTYTDKAVLVKVVVTDNGDGTLSSAVTVVEGSDMTFTNEYKPSEVQVRLTGTKRLTGRTLIADRYSFVVTDENGATVATGTNAADGSITFSPITYKTTGTHTYTVTEVQGTETGVEYDTASYTVTVEVTDNAGVLKADVTYPSGGVVFTNHYTPDDLLVRLTGAKVLTGATLKDKEFTFRVVDGQNSVVTTGTNDAGGTVTFNAIEYNFEDMTGADFSTAANGDRLYTKVFNYTVSEIIPDVARDPYMDYDDHTAAITVTVVYNATKAEWSYEVTGDTLTFNNHRYPDTITETIVASKNLTNNAQIPDAFFSVCVHEYVNGAEGKEVAAGAISATANKETVATLSFSTPGTYTYLVKESKAGKVDNGINYDTSAYLVTVVITQSEAGELSKSVSYSKLDGTSIERDEIVFNNEYNAAGYLTLHAKKALSGRSLLPGEFEFQVKDASGKVVATGTNDAAGNVTFGSIYYTLDNVSFDADNSAQLRYTMSEVKGSAPGVTYSGQTYNVTVSLTNANGVITATAAIDGVEAGQLPTFSNSYAPVTGDSITVSGTKTLTGRDLREGEFSFRLYHVDGQTETLVDSGTVGADGKWSITRVYPATVTPGTYNYKVKEVQGNTPGVTYTNEYYTFSVVITDDGKGGLDAQITNVKNSAGTEVSATALNFTNSYVPTAATFVPEVSKLLTGRPMSDGEFSFEVYAVYDNASPVLLSSGTSKADGSITFSPLTYSQAGEYTYLIQEVAGTLGGMTYDGSKIKMVVTVTDDGQGKLVASAKYYDEQDVQLTDPVFENTYKAADASVVLEGTKVLTGRDMREGEFSFVVKDASGTIVATGGNAAAKDGKQAAIAFSAISFAQAGEYTYTVSEVVKQVGDGVSYDTRTFTVTVTVTDNGNGMLESTVTYPAGGIAFSNTYDPTDVTVDLVANKTLTGKALQADEFTFLLKDNQGRDLQTKTNAADGTVTFDTLTYDRAGTYVYTLREVNSERSGYTYDASVFTVTVVIVDDGMGVLHVDSITYEDSEVQGSVSAMAFYNSYKPAPVYLDLDGALSVNKQVVSTSGAPYSPAGFTFMVYNPSNNRVAIGVSDANGTVTFYPYTDANGVTYGAEGYAGDETRDVGFTSADLYRLFIVEVTENPVDGMTYDSTYWEVHVPVEYDSVNGKLVIPQGSVYAHQHTGASTHDEGELHGETEVNFVNHYDPDDATITFGAVKNLDGPDSRPMVTGEFTFQLKDATGAVVATAVNDASGAISFTLDFDQVGTYRYTLSEVNGGQTIAGVEYDATVLTYVINVTDQGGKLVATLDAQSAEGFTNVYTLTDAQAVITAHKYLEGRDLTDGEFTFLLKQEDTVLAKGTNAADGTVTFYALDAAGEMTDRAFTLDYATVGTHTYTLVEEAGTLGGVTYDEMVYTVTVEVFDNQAGELKTIVTYAIQDSDGQYVTVDQANFYNTYAPESVDVTLSGTKALEGRDLADGEFEFVLSVVENEQVQELERAANAADGSFSFTTFTFDTVGTYTFTVYEVEGDKGGVDYDNTVYTVTVVVKDDLDGKLVADVTYEDQLDRAKTGLDFTNRYTPDPIQVELTATKVVKGDAYSAAGFLFDVYDVDGTLVTTGISDADGKITFADKLTFNAKGEYIYFMVERNDDTVTVPEGMVMDESIWEIHVVIGYDAAAGEFTRSAIVAHLLDAEDHSGSEDIEFVNTYTKPVSPNESPKTGDNSKIILVVVVLAVCLICLAVLLLLGKGKNGRGKHTGKRQG